MGDLRGGVYSSKLTYIGQNDLFLATHIKILSRYFTMFACKYLSCKI